MVPAKAGTRNLQFDLLRNAGLHVVRVDSPGEVVCSTRQILREEFQAAGVDFPLRGHRMPNDTANHPGEELYRLASDVLVPLGTPDVPVVPAARSGRVAAGPNVPPVAGRVVRAPSATWTRAWARRLKQHVPMHERHFRRSPGSPPDRSDAGCC
jgi:hypothetical protein